jgi:Zn-dependent M28 family amino/carboxypeptidase
MNAAAMAGTLDQLQMRLSLEAKVHRDLSGENVVAVIPGASDETIVLNAHIDAWYDGAGDNGDGLAVLVALARHFSRPEIQLQRTLVLVASAGHHTRGLNGPRAAVSLNPDLFDNSVLIFNLEHVAQRNFSPARSQFEDGYREYIADSGEAPIVAGITNQSPFLQQLFDRGVQRYGTNFVSGNSTMASGEGGGYRSAGVPLVTTMQAPPLYHTSGEVYEVVSTPGLERMARFMAWFVKQVDTASKTTIDP